MRSPVSQASDRYHQLIELYKAMHEKGDRFIALPAEETFAGESLLPHADNLKALFERYSVASCLDYGSGKGRQYTAPLIDERDRGKTYQGLRDYWDIDVECYDPAYAPFAELPGATFDAVLCTDVLEHCPEQDIDWIIDELFAHASKFVYASIACYPAYKRLPNGENTHVTIKDPQWWRVSIQRAAARFPKVDYAFLCENQERDRGEGGVTFAQGIDSELFGRSAVKFESARAKKKPLGRRLGSIIISKLRSTR
jgi:SAM-dependent methyltransferase